MSFNYASNHILITGASSGIGEHASYEAAKSGANLILCARRLDKLLEVKRQCEALGATSVNVFLVDIGDPESIDALLIQLEKKNLPVDVLINNAGFGHSEKFLDTDFDRILSLFKVNVLGLMYLTQRLAIKMLEQSGGQIINVASLAGHVSTPNYAVYGATKGAVISFSNALRMELKAHNVQVTVVNFGPVDTPFFDEIKGNRKEKAENSPFTLTVQQAGKTVNNVIGTKKREVNRPVLLGLGAKIYIFAPQLVDYILIKYYNE